MRLRRLRNGPLAVSRLRRSPHSGLGRGPMVVDCAVPGCVLDGIAHRHLQPAAPLQLENPPPAVEAPRPVPAANAWPDEAVLLSYAELRRLVALHLDLAWQGMPNRDPWLWVQQRSRSMREGESPLLLSEVMDHLPPG